MKLRNVVLEAMNNIRIYLTFNRNYCSKLDEH